LSTIKHVAARAGVSFTTVSHVLNGTRRVSDGARRRVEKAIADMGYSPSAVARALKTSETRIIGVVVPNITNPFFAELTRGIEDACESRQYSVFLCNGDDDPLRQGRALQTLLERRVDGMLFATPTGDEVALGKRLASVPMKAVVIDRALPGSGADLVRIDHQAGAELAVRHLLELGHRRIGCLAGPSQFAVARARVAGWRHALKAAGVRIAKAWLLEGDFSTAAGHALTRKLLDQAKVTAIFAGNDLMGIGVLRACAELGVAVPGQVSVIGFDSIDLGAYTYPALSTVGHPIRHLGELAATTLIDRIAGRHPKPREVVVTPKLILRESTGPVPR
jgi:LacI family transcriptional regulator